MLGFPACSPRQMGVWLKAHYRTQPRAMRRASVAAPLFVAVPFRLLSRKLANCDAASQPGGGAMPLLLQRKPRAFHRARQRA